jgi:hypothetical protein
LKYDENEFENVWRSLDDVIMGGKSSSFAKVQTLKKGNKTENIVRLEGDINANGGGFVSIRTKNF